jgi:hypothetical protein
MLALTLLSRTVVAIIMVFVLSAMLMAVLVTTSSSAIIAAAIVPPLILLLLIMDNNSAIGFIVSMIFRRWHGGAGPWRHLISMAVFVMVVARRGPGLPPLSPAGAGWDRDRIFFLASLPPAQL